MMIEPLYDFSLTAEQEARARTLHESSIILDMLFQGPVGTYSLPEGAEEELLALAQEACPGDEIAQCNWATAEILRRMIGGSYSQLYKDCWYDSGLTGGCRQLSVTDRDEALRSAVELQAEFDTYPWLVKCTSVEQIRRCKKEGLKAGIVTSQEAEGYSKDLKLLELLYNYGLRVQQLSYNNQNLIGAGCMEPNGGAGLSKFGIRFVEKCNELGIVVDTGHCGYLTVGQYTDIIFPSYDVRFIAVNDGVDSNRGDSEGFAAIRNLFNEWYPRDTSKKVRVSLRQRGTSGKHMGKPPYGYRCDPEDKDHWILDEEAAQVVKLIFDLCIDGKGPEQIARILEEKQILTTRALYAKRKKKPMPERPYHWGNQSIVAILEWQEYTGCTCNFKTYSKSYKLKKRIPNEPEDMFYLPDTQEAIVSQAQFDRVQELRKNKRRPVKAERQGLFSGLLFCADCGSKLHFATSKRFEGKQDRYVCCHYKSNRGTCTAHYIREDVLREIVLERIRAVNEYIRDDVDAFQEEWLQCRRTDQERSIRDDKKKVEQAKKRLFDLDVIISWLYEDYVLGNISQDRYKKMSADYEAEQERLKLEIEVIEEWVEQREEMNDGLDAFIVLTQKYVDVEELTQTIVNKYIKKIVVYAPDKSSGKRTQKVKIYFNFVDDVDIPIISEPITTETTYGPRKTA